MPKGVRRWKFLASASRGDALSDGVVPGGEVAAGLPGCPEVMGLVSDGIE